MANTNDYYNNADTLADGNLAKASEVKAELDAIQSAFDLLPKPNGAGDGFSVPVKVGDATDPSHAVTKAVMDQHDADIQAIQAYVTSKQALAAASAAAAATSETNTAKSEGNAATSESNAAASEVLSQKYANNPEDIEVVSGEYSSLHYMKKSEHQVYLAQVAAQSVADAVDVGIKQNMTFFGLNLMEKI